MADCIGRFADVVAYPNRDRILMYMITFRCKVCDKPVRPNGGNPTPIKYCRPAEGKTTSPCASKARRERDRARMSDEKRKASNKKRYAAVRRDEAQYQRHLERKRRYARRKRAEAKEARCAQTLPSGTAHCG